ncbi:proline-specific peptidase [Gloeopeniophorella convolvens]|nr:proline-specific peptidase [Gloeopeniophorella convolvens]
MPSETSGFIDFTYAGETHKTWYKAVGDLASGVTPVVILHGGPGIPHFYLLPNLELTRTNNIPTIIYDQIGVGQSSHLKDKPKEFWTVELFMDELDNLLSKLGIADNFGLIGHSWGGMFGSDYVATRQPRGLRRLVLVGAPASMTLWEASMAKLLSRFPEDFQAMMKKHDEERTTDAKEYQDGMQVFYQKHICNVNPWPADLLKSFAGMAEDPTVYTAMLGTSVFRIWGSLRTWSVVDKIDKIGYPTLLLNGVDDEAQDEALLPFFEKLPKVKWVQFANSSHTIFFEEKDRYLQVVGDFLTSRVD